MDGTSAGFYIREGSDKNLFMIDLKGGGACFNKHGCDERVQKKKGTSRPWPATMVGGNTLHADCKKNPDFCDATAVFVPYCTSDQHLGVREEPSEDSFGYTFQGRLNLELMVDILIEDYGLGKPGMRVLLTGASAGAHSAFLTVDWLADRLPNAIVKAAPRVGKTEQKCH